MHRFGYDFDCIFMCHLNVGMCENVRTDAFIALSLITYVNDRLRLLFTYVLQARFNAKKL